MSRLANNDAALKGRWPQASHRIGAAIIGEPPALACIRARGSHGQPWRPILLLAARWEHSTPHPDRAVHIQSADCLWKTTASHLT